MRRLNREVNEAQPNLETPHPLPKKTRKAANLAELRRYFDAATEAASEVQQPLDSSDAAFREKLREKLVASGGIACKIKGQSRDAVWKCRGGEIVHRFPTGNTCRAPRRPPARSRVDGRGNG